jgi:transcriptional antiterminator RfaH
MERWFVVHTHAHAEELAKRNLERQGFHTYLPVYIRRRRHARRVTRVRRPLFPRYLFVAMDIEQTRWRAIQSTIGVVQLVCFGTRPAPMPEGVVEAITERENSEGVVDTENVKSLKPGDKVQILAGALMDRIGMLLNLTDDERVVVMLDLLGRPVKVELPGELISACA